jgi:hypothetical protein
MITLEIIYEYLRKDNKLVKFTNVADFPTITGSTKTILEEFGLIHDPYTSPSMECNGKLKQLQDDLILVGESAVGTNFCLDMQMRFVLISPRLNSPRILNSSLEKYMRCTYAFSNFMRYQVFKETLGTWNDSHPKYAAVLKDLLEAEDTGCTDNVLWSSIIEEMENGI